MRTTAVLLLLLCPSVLAAQQDMEEPVRLMNPADTAIPGLPPVIRADIIARNCLVPWRGTDSTFSAIRGGFRGPGHLDWAVLCVQGDSARILVYLANEGDPSDSLPAGKAHSLQVATPEYIIEHLQSYSEDTTLVSKTDSLKQAILHEGIEETDNRCCSVIHYWEGGKWLQYPGAD